MNRLPAESLLAILCLALCCLLGNAQNVGIGTTTPASSAQLDISSTTRGFLIPRMTTAQRNAIASPAVGLQVFNLDDKCTDTWNGTAWIKTCGASTSMVPNPNGAWTKKSDFGGGGRDAAFGFTIGTKLYLGGGISAGFSSKNDLWEYDPATGIWTQKQSIPTGGRLFSVGFTIGGKGYVIGGTVSGVIGFPADFWEYDPVGNTWTQKANFPRSTGNAPLAFGIGDKGYAGGGYNGAYQSDWHEYNPATNTWTAKAPLPGPRLGAAWFVINGIGYFATSKSGFDNTNDCYAYDPVANTWTQRASFPGAPRQEATGFAIGQKGYIGAGGFNKDFWEYDPANNNWTRKADYGGIGPRLAVGFAIGQKGYIGTGGINSEPYVSAGFWEYDPNGTSLAIHNDFASANAYQYDDGSWNRAGTKLITANNDFSVGIGTASPGAKLDVAGTIKSTGLQLSTGAANGYFLKSDANGLASWAAIAETDPKVGVNTTNYLSKWNGSALVSSTVVETGGNVGIGTNAPGRRLDVAGTGGLRVNSTNPGSGTADWIAGNFGGTAGDRVVMGNQSAVATLGAHNNALNAWANLAINPFGGNVGIGTIGPANKLSITGNADLSGNLGIGTPAPAYKLDIVGTSGPRVRVFSQDNNYAGYIAKNNSREFFAGVQGTVETPNPSSGYHIFDNTAGQQRMVIDQSGNMGIGTPAPLARLDVNGTVKIGTSGTVFNNIIKVSVNIGAVGVIANTSAGILLGVANTVTGASVMVSPSVPLPTGVSIGFARVPFNGNVEVVFVNGGTANQMVPAMTLYITVVN